MEGCHGDALWIRAATSASQGDSVCCRSRLGECSPSVTYKSARNNTARISVDSPQSSDFKDKLVADLFIPRLCVERPVRCVDFEAERRMLREILVDAIECWQAVSLRGFVNGDLVAGLRERLYREANVWIFGEYDNAPFFSFTQVCECLGLDPDFIRRRLLQWRRESKSPLTLDSHDQTPFLGETQE